uniref:EOG090X07RL n=1 Tax=Eubosmina coregoni TaxID=186181 RepID=A0A4Y7LRA1_9CRUS|nr:EOG090X07RL [Eubosmina coregoni]SVE69853.1 EOG090X07RL [Eubosmina coregoni]
MARRGVLRHKQLLADAESKDKFEDLLVFGYACKLFRDDEKALSIDQGKLLIPWMGDDTIKIDRYDARGTLFDLKSFETPPGGYDRSEGLTGEEKRIEQLCDEERYFALYKDEAEEATIKEEEIKRLNQDLNDVTSEDVSYHQVPFSYNNQTQGNDSTLTSKEAPVKSIIGELGDVLYVPPPSLDVPPGIAVPPTLKLARIVEKTALFISTQGPQMEIIVKAKQANNPMFEFLHFDCALHPFYRHVLAAIRNGAYVVPSEEELESGDNKTEQNVPSDNESDNYLHPSLQPKAEEQVASPSQNASITENSFPHPAPEIRPLIDKTASYMSRNGRHLESYVQAKGDTRFAFLYPVHTLHSYYLHKLSIYTEIHKNQPTVTTSLQSAPVIEKVAIKVEPVVERIVNDQELMRIERRKKAALFLDQMKKERVAAGEGSSSALDEDFAADSESTTTSTAQKSKSSSPDEVEIIGAIPRESKERTRRHRKEKKKRRSSRDRGRKKSRRHRSRSRDRSRSGSAASSGFRSPVIKSRSPSSEQQRHSPITIAVRKLAEDAATKSAGSETSSPLPSKLLTIQPAYAKIAEGIRAKLGL